MAASSNSTRAPVERTFLQAADDGADQHLEALYARFVQSFAAVEAADKRADEIDASLVWPEASPAALVREGDDELGLLSWVRDSEAPIGEPYPPNTFGVRHAADLREFYSPGEPGHAAACRAQEILVAQAADKDARHALLRDTGYSAAEAAAREALEANRADRDALARAQAASLRGVLLKAQAVASLESDSEALEVWLDDESSNCPGSMTALAVSLTLDLIRMASSSA